MMTKRPRRQPEFWIVGPYSIGFFANNRVRVYRKEAERPATFNYVTDAEAQRILREGLRLFAQQERPST